MQLIIWPAMSHELHRWCACSLSVARQATQTSASALRFCLRALRQSTSCHMLSTQQAERTCMMPSVAEVTGSEKSPPDGDTAPSCSLLKAHSTSTIWRK